MRLALEDTNGKIIEIFNENKTRIDLPGVGQISPVPMGDIGNGFTVCEVKEFVIPAGKRIVGKATHRVVAGKLEETFATEAAPAPEVLTVAQRIDRLFAAHGITAVEFKAHMDLLK